MKFIAILEQIKEENSIVEGKLPYSVAQEYLNAENKIDYSYFIKKHKVNGSIKDFAKAVKKVFGFIEFESLEPTDEMTKEEFLDIYEFGKFPVVRHWLNHIRQDLGRDISKQDLFQWIMSTSAPSKARYSTSEVNNFAY